MIEPRSRHVASQCRLDWGRQGAMQGARRGDIIVIVDVLSFSTSVAVAVDHGACIYPCGMEDDAGEIADRVGGEAAVRRSDVPAKGRFSLSPLTYCGIDAGTRVVLASPNGATCSDCVSQAEFVIAGGLVNAAAVGEAVNGMLRQSRPSVTVIACGELEQAADGDIYLRWALEDYLGAGAILSHIDAQKSPDAIVCETAYVHSRGQLQELIRDCRSGDELRAMGFGEDVTYAAREDILASVPVLKDGRFENHIP